MLNFSRLIHIIYGLDYVRCNFQPSADSSELDEVERGPNVASRSSGNVLRYVC